MGNKPNPERPQSATLIMDAQMIANEAWYTTGDIMQLFKISRSSVYRLRMSKQLPSCQLGGTIVFPKSLINKVLLDKALSQAKGFFEE
ncbi:helix-turn-helix domain-containing protein [Hanstruepera neustonica]|nr:helix-turn-helix domain-containing protein [Hanstruepera neustonica]